MESELKVLKASFSNQNILSLDTPETYQGRLWKYQAGHSVLVLELRQHDESELNSIYVGFEPTYYIDLPAWWKGCSIKTASKTETLSLYYKLGFWSDLSNEAYAELEDSPDPGIRLYLIETSIGQHKILATPRILLGESLARY